MSTPRTSGMGSGAYARHMKRRRGESAPEPYRVEHKDIGHFRVWGCIDLEKKQLYCIPVTGKEGIAPIPQISIGQEHIMRCTPVHDLQASQSRYYDIEIDMNHWFYAPGWRGYRRPAPAIMVPNAEYRVNIVETDLSTRRNIVFHMELCDERGISLGSVARARIEGPQILARREMAFSVALSRRAHHIVTLDGNYPLPEGWRPHMLNGLKPGRRAELEFTP